MQLTNLILLFLACLLACSNGLEKIERTQQLSSRLSVDWTADFSSNYVTFKVTAETRGFIGFGLSPKGGMNGADVIIGGVLDDGEIYFTDRWASKTEEPKIDDHQDWFLISAVENATHTVLLFNRTFDTCDNEDLPITNDTIKFIWSLGETDEIKYHGDQRGAAAVNILDFLVPNYDTSKYDTWDIKVNTTIPSTDSTYWCTIHKSPKFSSKRQIVGFETKLNSEGALKHNHHLLVRHCKVDKNDAEMIALFERYVTHPGGQCFYDDGTGIQQFQTLCTQIYVWAKGGTPVFLPDNVGLVLNEDGAAEYFMLDLHYDNPQLLSGVQYDTGVRLYFTEDLREHDAGLSLVSYAVDITQTVPPNSQDFVYAAHCSSRCTNETIPAGGFEIFIVLHHAHLAGRKLKFRQFRPQADGSVKELPWISVDNNYDFDFQQNRILRENVRILPGDHLTVECSYDNTWHSPPSSTFGGYSTREEMCEAVFMYYPKHSLGYCGSYHPMNDLLPILGIDSIDSTSNPVDPTVLKPEEWAGQNFTSVVNNFVNWTDDRRANLQTSVLTNDHIEQCLGQFPVRTGSEETYWTNYPTNFEEYVPPPSNCDAI